MDSTRCPKTQYLHALMMEEHPLWRMCPDCNHKFPPPVIEISSSSPSPPSDPPTSLGVVVKPEMVSDVPIQLQTIRPSLPALTLPANAQKGARSFGFALSQSTAARSEPYDKDRRPHFLYPFQVLLWSAGYTNINIGPLPGKKWTIARHGSIQRFT